MLNLAHLIDEYNRQQRAYAEPIMTQRRLAGLTGMNEATIHRHVTGKTSLSLEQALAYARVLNCNVEDLVSAEPEAVSQ